MVRQGEVAGPVVVDAHRDHLARRQGDHRVHPVDRRQQGGQGRPATEGHPRGAARLQGRGEPGHLDVVAEPLLGTDQDRLAGHRLAAPGRDGGRPRRDQGTRQVDPRLHQRPALTIAAHGEIEAGQAQRGGRVVRLQGQGGAEFQLRQVDAPLGGIDPAQGGPQGWVAGPVARRQAQPGLRLRKLADLKERLAEIAGQGDGDRALGQLAIDRDRLGDPAGIVQVCRRLQRGPVRAHAPGGVPVRASRACAPAGARTLPSWMM